MDIEKAKTIVSDFIERQTRYRFSCASENERMTTLIALNTVMNELEKLRDRLDTIVEFDRGDEVRTFHCGRCHSELRAVIHKQEPVKPVRVSISPSEYDFIGKNGILKVGNCPACGQSHINNGDNKYCGGCGRPVDWS